MVLCRMRCRSNPLLYGPRLLVGCSQTRVVVVVVVAVMGKSQGVTKLETATSASFFLGR